jgi:hypothetical protein
MKTKRTRERLIQLARSVNDHVVGKHIGQLCRDMADELEIMGDAVAGALVVSECARRIIASHGASHEHATRPSQVIIVSIGDEGGGL